jgi:peroxiredoxin
MEHHNQISKPVIFSFIIILLIGLSYGLYVVNSKTKSGTIYGKFTLEGEVNHSGIEVGLYKNEIDKLGQFTVTKTDSTGDYRIENIPFGEYRFIVIKPDFDKVNIPIIINKSDIAGGVSGILKKYFDPNDKIYRKRENNFEVIKNLNVSGFYEVKAFIEYKKLESEWIKETQISDGAIAISGNKEKEWANKFWNFRSKYYRTIASSEATVKTFMLMQGNADFSSFIEKYKQVSIDDRAMEVIVEMILPMFSAFGKSDEGLQEINRIVENSKNTKVKITGLHQLAINYYFSDEYEKAKEPLKKLVSDDYKYYEHTWYIKNAKKMFYDIETLAAGNKAPSFVSKDLSGKDVSLDKLKGKVVLLDFWAVWCKPCIMELPNVKNVYQKFKNKNFIVIGISLDQDLEQLKKFIKSEKMEWPQLFDGKIFQGEIPELYGVIGIPKTFLIDKNGIIAYKNLRAEELEKAIEEMLLSKL